jgi:hypothetical protein
MESCWLMQTKTAKVKKAEWRDLELSALPQSRDCTAIAYFKRKGTTETARQQSIFVEPPENYPCSGGNGEPIASNAVGFLRQYNEC